jgi:hypothetical protein
MLASRCRTNPERGTGGHAGIQARGRGGLRGSCESQPCERSGSMGMYRSTVATICMRNRLPTARLKLWDEWEHDEQH